MIIELLVLLIVYSIPLGLTLWSLFSSYFKYPSYAIFRVIIITVLVGVWVYASIPWTLDLKLSHPHVILLAHVGSIMGAIARIMIATSFTKPDLGVVVHRSALVSISLTSILIGIRIVEIFENDNSYYGIEKSEYGWRESLHPMTEIILFTGVITLFLSFYYTIKGQKSIPKSLLDSNLNKIYYQVLILLIFGGLLSLINQFFIINSDSEFYISIYVISRFSILFAFLLLALFISQNPIFIFQEKSNLMKPIDDGVIGWMLSFNGDMGPETLNYSKKFETKFNIDEGEFTSFSASVITVIGITKSFYSSVFILPFSSRDLFTTLNISFNITEPSLKDPRLKNQALSVLSIIFPKSLVAKIRGFDEAESLLLSKIQKYQSLTEFATEANLSRITSQLLETIIS